MDLHVRSIENVKEASCKFCHQIYEMDTFKEFVHQPGYAALRASSIPCSLCSIFLMGLERAVLCRIEGLLGEKNQAREKDQVRRTKKALLKLQPKM
jgi:hypothetical protein